MSVENEPRSTSSFFKEEDAEKPVIDNQIAAYKAVAPSALISMTLGVLSVLSFTDLSFTLLGLGGIIAGVLAQAKIKRFPDAWTGKKWAERGIALSLLFSLGAISIAYTQEFLRIQSAKVFARELEQTIATKSLDDVIIYMASPDSRKSKPPKELIMDLRKGEMDPRMFDQKTKAVIDMKAFVDEKGSTVAFEKFEGINAEEFRVFAIARYKVSGPGNRDFPAGDHYLLVKFNGRRDNGKYRWMVDEFVFPYVPKSK